MDSLTGQRISGCLSEAVCVCACVCACACVCMCSCVCVSMCACKCVIYQMSNIWPRRWGKEEKEWERKEEEQTEKRKRGEKGGSQEGEVRVEWDDLSHHSWKTQGIES